MTGTIAAPTRLESKALVELAQRQNMALSMFRPLEHQEPFFRNWARQHLLRGGNRSTPKGTRLWACKKGYGNRPVNMSIVKVEDLEVGDTVVGFTEHGTRNDLRPAVVTSIDQYPESTYRLTTKRGYVLEGTHDHPVWACPPLPGRYHNSVDPDWKKAEWVLLRDVPEDWYVRMAFGSYIDWVGEQDNDAYYHGLMDGDGSVLAHRSTSMTFSAHKDEKLRFWIADYVHDRAPNVRLRVLHKSENGVDTTWASRALKDEYFAWSMPGTPEAMSSYIRGLFDADGCVTSDGKIVFIQKDTERVRLVQNILLMFGIRCSAHLQRANIEQKRPNPIWRLQVSGYSVKRYEKSIGFGDDSKREKLGRITPGRRKPVNGKMWWDRVDVCGPTGEVKDIIAIATSTETYISNGIVSHNSGKSTCAAAMFAGAAIDWDITMGDGTKIPMRRPWQKGRPLRMWVIGFDLKHIGQTIHRLLFQPGLFKIIKDETTGQYRTFKPWVPEDAARESEAKASPPLIPSRYVEPGSWDWENKKGREFKSVKIRDPLSGHRLAEIFAYSSKADPKAGDPVDFIWIDEAIENADHFKEWRARLFDLRGSLIWSSWPAVNNDALATLTEEAVKEAKKPNPLVRETVITLSANKALSQEVRDEALGMFTSEEERRARDRGEYVTDLLRMYPLFDEYIHQAIVDGDPDEVSRILRATGGTPPQDWTVELVLDPGTAHPGVLFCAIPPHLIGRGRSFVVWDELSPDRHDATQLAKLVADKLGGRRANRFIIDWQAGRRKAEGYEITIGDNYKRAFKKAGIVLEDGELNWTIGSNNVGGRIGILQEHMHIEPNGLPKLRIVRNRCEKLCAQLIKYKKYCVNNDVKDDKPASGQTIDLAVALEYFIASSPQYVIPRHGIAKKTVAADWAEFLEIRKRANKPKRVSYSVGPSYAVSTTPKVEL
jgi:hypothetical protein